jgi:hypothetical protein
MAEKKKKFNLKLTIARVEPEKNLDGVVSYRMTLETEKGEYERSVAKKEWEDPQAKRSIVKHWVNDIGGIEADTELSDEELTAKAKQITGEEISDE